MPSFDFNKVVTIALLVSAIGLYYFFYLRRKTKGEGGGGGSVGGVLGTYTRDLTAEARRGDLDPVIGRDDEIERTMHILARRTKNNPLLLGEPGVGKTAIIEGIARRIATGKVPGVLKDKQVLALDLNGLISGTKYRGEFEKRMNALTSEIAGLKRHVILFIDEVHMIEQAKGAEGALNISDILKPALARGDLQMIGATTNKEYEINIKPDDALNRRLQPVNVGEPSEKDTLHILKGIKSIYGEYHGVTYDPEAVKAAVSLSKKILGRFYPDKAIDILDEAGAKVAMQAEKMGATSAKKPSRSVLLKKKAGISKGKRELEHEMTQLKKLKGIIPDVDLDDIMERVEQVRDELDKVYVKAAQKTSSARVRVSDIREVVEDWLGKK